MAPGLAGGERLAAGILGIDEEQAGHLGGQPQPGDEHLPEVGHVLGVVQRPGEFELHAGEHLAGAGVGQGDQASRDRLGGRLHGRRSGLRHQPLQHLEGEELGQGILSFVAGALEARDAERSSPRRSGSMRSGCRSSRNWVSSSQRSPSSRSIKVRGRRTRSRVAVMPPLAGRLPGRRRRTRTGRLACTQTMASAARSWASRSMLSPSPRAVGLSPARAAPRTSSRETYAAVTRSAVRRTSWLASAASAS